MSLTQTPNESILDWAKKYITMGWHVLPLFTVDADGRCSCGKPDCADAGKHPSIPKGVINASRDMVLVEQWFGENAKPANIGIATGAMSGITVIDIDTAPGKLGAESWAEVIKEHGEPTTLTAITGSGGFHAIFKYNSTMKTAANVLGKGIDCRNDKGYIVAAPSHHESGGVYKWIDFNADSIEYLPFHLTQRKETRGRPTGKKWQNKRYSVEQVACMLECIPADDRGLWLKVGIILGREFNCIDAAWDAYNEWSDKWGGKKGRHHDKQMHTAFYTDSSTQGSDDAGLGTIIHLAQKGGWAPKKGDVPVDDFLFYGPGNNFIYRQTGSYWTVGAVDAAVSPVNDDGQIMKASDWLKANALATSLTIDPGIEGDYIKGVNCRDGEIIEGEGAAVYNGYRRATIELGDASLAQPFLNHCERIFSKEGDCAQFLDYMAHRVQVPEEKPRFALLIAGGQGVGKDTAVEFCCPAIGPWNVANIDPSAFESHFNEFASATLVRISEAANLHEMSKWAFNERTKVLISGSPDSVAVNPKYGQKFTVRMHCGVILTTNHLIAGIYIPPDDRRYDVINCATLAEMGLTNEDAKSKYFFDLWQWFLHSDGMNHVAAYLSERDISKFSASGGQRKTDAHSAVIFNGAASDDWLLDALDSLGSDSDMVRGDYIYQYALNAGEKEGEIKKRMGNALGRCGYTLYQNPASKDGRWRVAGRGIRVFVKAGAVIDGRREVGDLKGGENIGETF